ncbi:tetratricopeptide repeat-containing protein [uncultured Kordia sp.]|uniref:tetratricopeptide repeat-containing protein n=1 Tax=uncultured Kordia sp. TaxID=507699 RepID=UPI002612D12E|nr:tetratricopeptide repeat-containing protein [uncultured Kordia sp.]
MKKTCFVIMGYGKKPDPETKRIINLDETFTEIIKPTFNKLKIECFRSSDLKETGTIDYKMYEYILKSDYVLADISTLNANAVYELGVRHALRPNTTIIIAEDKLTIPFNLSHVKIHKYKHFGKFLAAKSVKNFKKYLKNLILNLENKPLETDSPVYTFLPALNPPSFTKQEMREIKESLNKPDSISELIDLAESKKNKGKHTSAIKYLNQALKQVPNKHDSFIIQQLALNTYKSKVPNVVDSLWKAQKILKALSPEETTDPETLGLLGAIYKRLYQELKEEKYLTKSLHYYERGYYINQVQDYYVGINVAFLYIWKASISKNKKLSRYANYGQAIKIWKEIIQKWEKKINTEYFEKRGDKVWIYLTLAEAYLGVSNEQKEQEYIALASKISNVDFALNSYKEQKEKLTHMLEKLKKLQ